MNFSLVSASTMERTRNFSILIPGEKALHEIRVLDFIQNFLYIRPKKQDENDDTEEAPLVLFKLNPQQMKLYLKVEDDWCHYRPIRYVILKARQIGFSTLIAAILFSLTLYSPYKESLVIADKDDHTVRIFDMYQRFYDNLPEQLKPVLISNKKGQKLTTSAHSTVNVETVSEDIARGATLLGVHASEFGMWRKQKEANATLSSALPLIANSLWFIESTAKGMNEFRDIFMKAYEGKSRMFKAHFAPWYENAGYREPYHGEELYTSGDYDDEVALYNEYKDKGMTLEGLMWRRTQIDAMGLDLFHQEFPTYPDEAFLSTGVSVFNTKSVSKRLHEVEKEPYKKRGYFTYESSYSRDGRRISVTNIKWVDDSEGDFIIYEEPKPGYPYVIGADPAGINGKDNFVAQVLRHDDNCRKQVAKFSRQKMDPDEFGIQLYCLGTYYNTALIGVETNTGQDTNKTLAQAGYRKIYVKQRQETFTEPALNEYGIATEGTNKEDNVNKFKARFREHPEEVVDPRTLREMLTFVVLDVGKNGSYKMGAATPSDHDDHVMAYVIAIAVSESTQQTTHVNIEVARKSSLPWQLQSPEPKKQGGGLWKRNVIS